MSNIKFAVVREDHLIEQALIEETKTQNVLMIASGGCTALSLKSLFPNVDFTLFDTNKAQIELVKRKVEALKKYTNDSFNRQFNIEFDGPVGLNNCGEFESLFRSFRQFLTEFILSEKELRDIILGNISARILIDNKYWKVAFDLFFSNSLLVTMFGSDAIQHAEPNSYPRYFQKIFENGFRKPNFTENYFLHHVFVGYYLNDINSLPYYLQKKISNLKFEYINNTLLNINNLGKFGLVSLSNIFDWMAETEVLSYLEYLKNNLNSGAFIIFRQLNNNKNYLDKIGGFKSHNKLENDLLVMDRSLFYNKINILEKI